MSRALPRWHRKTQEDGCIKTGFDGYLKEYGKFVHGDLFRYGNVYIVRVSEQYYTPSLGTPINMIINHVSEWFDNRPDTYSTLIAMVEDCSAFDYDGVSAGSASLLKSTQETEQADG